jgi:hypothetical protein
MRPASRCVKGPPAPGGRRLRVRRVTRGWDAMRWHGFVCRWRSSRHLRCRLSRAETPEPDPARLGLRPDPARLGFRSDRARTRAPRLAAEPAPAARDAGWSRRSQRGSRAGAPEHGAGRSARASPPRGAAPRAGRIACVPVSRAAAPRPLLMSGAAAPRPLPRPSVVAGVAHDEPRAASRAPPRAAPRGATHHPAGSLRHRPRVRRRSLGRRAQRWTPAAHRAAPEARKARARRAAAPARAGSARARPR